VVEIVTTTADLDRLTELGLDLLAGWDPATFGAWRRVVDDLRRRHTRPAPEPPF